MTLDLNTIDTSNPEALLGAFEQLERGEAPAPAPAPAAAEPAPAPAPAADAEVKGNEPPAQAEVKKDEQSQTSEPEPDGVATKDGKHIIPYTVLRSERERANRAEQLLRDAQAQLDALRTQKPAAETGSEGAKPGESARTDATPDVTDLSAEELAALKEDFPSVHKAITTAMAAAKAVESKLKSVEQAHEDQQQAAQRTAQESVQDAIDATPKLAHIQASEPELFEMAKQFDATLRASPAWAGKPLAERFAKVAEMVEQANGPINLPGKAASQQQTPEQLRAAAQARAQASARATGSEVPTSLSEFPAGSPPVSDERQAVENMSQQQLAEKFAGMTFDQMDAYLEKL